MICQYCGHKLTDGKCINPACPGRLVDKIVNRLRAKADNSYNDYISINKRDECLGWEIKVERGKFGKAELDAHMAASKKLGRYQALCEAVKLINEEYEEVIPL